MCDMYQMRKSTSQRGGRGEGDSSALTWGHTTDGGTIDAVEARGRQQLCSTVQHERIEGCGGRGRVNDEARQCSNRELAAVAFLVVVGGPASIIA